MAVSVSEIPHIAGRAFFFFGLVSGGLAEDSATDMFSNISSVLSAKACGETSVDVFSNIIYHGVGGLKV